MSQEDQDPAVETAALGAGVMPFGTGPAGGATVATAAASPDVSAGSRYLDPITKDYQIASTTAQQAQMPPTRQRVLLALTTLKGSATASRNFGLQAPRKMGTRFDQEMKAATRAALRHLTNENQPVIVIQRIDVHVPRGGRAVVTVSYLDVSTGQPDQAGAQV